MIKTKTLLHLIICLSISLIFSCKKDSKNNTANSSELILNKDVLDIQVTDSVITINNQKLFFEDSLWVWEKPIGKYNRKSSEIGIGVSYIWDSLGLQLTTDNQGYKTGWSRELVRELNIHFLGLDSPEAKTGEFPGAEEYDFVTYRDSLDVIESTLKRYDYRKTKDEIMEEANRLWALTKTRRNPQNYLYPYSGFRGSLSINGIEITANKHLKDLNKERWDSGNNLFRYIDNSSSWHGENKTGETEMIYDIYYYLAQPVKMSKNHPIWYEIKYLGEDILYVSIKLVPPDIAQDFIERQ